MVATSSDGRILVPKLEFYITNVCNLTCEHCNRFNDQHFKGWQRWSDYAEAIEQWDKKIAIEHPVILGGEPLLNPTILDWISGVSRMSTRYAPQILTNGTYIDRVDGLYETCRQARNTWIGVSLHNLDQREEIYERIRNFYPTTSRIKQVVGKENTKTGSDRSFIDQNNIKVEVWEQTEFVKSALTTNIQGRLTLNNSKPEIAFSKCQFARSKNYHLIKGQIYRCGPSALFPELDDQFNLDLSDQDKQLIRSYRPLSVDHTADQLLEFFEHIDDMIPQCKFCPEDDSLHVLKFFPKYK